MNLYFIHFITIITVSITTALAQVPIPSTEPANSELTNPELVSNFDLNRADIYSFITEMAQRHHLPAEEIMATLAQAKPEPRIIQLMTRPAESVMPWWQYHDKLVTNERILEGVKFWKQHRIKLDSVYEKYGVDPAYVVAIIGIETSYGRNKGTWHVLDALMTLGFNYPPRSNFFKSELENFLMLSKEENFNLPEVLGSYAGAMGAPQFMPSSYRHYALDGNGDGKRDLFNNWDDIITSVSNYFFGNGWIRGGLVLAEASAAPEALPAIMGSLERKNLDLNNTAASLREKKIIFESMIPAETAAILLPAELHDTPNIRIGFHNFKVITRYNRSILYAMAVHDIATEIQKQMTMQP